MEESPNKSTNSPTKKYNALLVGNTGASTKIHMAYRRHISIVAQRLKEITEGYDTNSVDIYDFGMLKTYYSPTDHLDNVKYLSNNGIQFKTSIDFDQDGYENYKAIKHEILSINIGRVLVCVPKGERITNSLSTGNALCLTKPASDNQYRVQFMPLENNF